MAATDNSTGRRRFIEWLLGTGVITTLASFFYPAMRFLTPPANPDLGAGSVVAAKAGELKPNSGKIFRFGAKPGLLLQKPDGEYRAMSAVCTHLSCTVQYRSDRALIWCACHDGWYDLEGRNIAGPPPRPLEPYELHVRGDEVVVDRRRAA